jgi:hypothetical protein
MNRRFPVRIGDDEGRIPTFPFDMICIPAKMWVEGGWLMWLRHETYTAAPSPDLLSDFLNVNSADDVLKFARRRGILGLCEKHGWPGWHSIHDNDFGRLKGRPCLPYRANDACGERIDDWLLYATQARAVLNLAARLHQSQPGEAGDWAPLGLLPRNCELSIAAQRKWLAQFIDDWIRCGRVRPQFKWEHEQPTVELSGSLYSAIGLQLMGTASGQRGVGWCASCAQWFRTSGRAPKRSQRNYCDECRKNGNARRHAVQASRADALRASRAEKRKSDATLPPSS